MYFFYMYNLRFSSTDRGERIRTEKYSAMTISFKIYANIILFSFMMKVFNTSRYTRDGYFL